MNREIHHEQPVLRHTQECIECNADATVARWYVGALNAEYLCDRHAHPPPDYQAIAAQLAAALEGLQTRCADCGDDERHHQQRGSQPDDGYHKWCFLCDECDHFEALPSVREALATYREATQQADTPQRAP